MHLQSAWEWWDRKILQEALTLSCFCLFLHLFLQSVHAVRQVLQDWTARQGGFRCVVASVVGRLDDRPHPFHQVLLPLSVAIAV